jgi:hypothetical protein
MQFHKELFKLKNKISRFQNGSSPKVDYRNFRVVATDNILKIFLSLYEKVKNSYKDNRSYSISIYKCHSYYNLSLFFVKEIPHLKSIEFKLDKNIIKSFSDCTDFDAAALLSFRLQRNFISYFVKNSFFYVRKITKNERMFLSIELYYIKDYISEMWHEESEEYIKLMNDLDKDCIDRFSSVRYYNATKRYEKKFWKLQKKKLKYKIKILKKKINPDHAKIVKQYSTIDKDYDAMEKYVDKNYRRDFLLKSKKLHKKTLKSKLSILERHINPDLSKKIKEYYWISANDYIKKKNNNNDYIQIKTYNENMIADLAEIQLEWDNPTSPYWPMSETCPYY